MRWIRAQAHSLRWWLVCAVFLIGSALSPLVIMITQGQRPSTGHFDAAVVFGARVYEDGTPSNALDDRIVAACALYNAGRCSAIICSGGPGDGETSEAEAMRERALALGVPSSAIVIDNRGINTRASAMNAARICHQRGWTRVVGVTHFYHTPRAGMMLSRAGLDADTEPAPMRTGVLRGLGYFMTRECAAWWVDRLRLRDLLY